MNIFTYIVNWIRKQEEESLRFKKERELWNLRKTYMRKYCGFNSDTNKWFIKLPNGFYKEYTMWGWEKSGCLEFIIIIESVIPPAL
jgi:hypothetical protein